MQSYKNFDFYMTIILKSDGENFVFSGKRRKNVVNFVLQSENPYICCAKLITIYTDN